MRFFLNKFASIFLAVMAANAFAGFDEGRKAYEQGKYTTAMNELQPIADGGNADAQAMVGVMLQTGVGLSTSLAEGVPVDEQRAISYFVKAAVQNNVCGAYRAGLAYMGGNGVSQNLDTGKKFLKIAADSGEKSECAGRAQWELAKLMYGTKNKIFYGSLWQSLTDAVGGVDRNGAIEYAKLANASGVDWSKDKANGKKVPADVMVALQVEEEKKSEVQHLRDLQKQRTKEDEEDDKDVIGGSFFAHSDPVPSYGEQKGISAENNRVRLRLDAALRAFEKRDYEAAFRKFKHQADRNFVEADVFLGLMLHDGLGVQKDDDKAFKYFDRALLSMPITQIRGNSEMDQKRKKYFTYAHFYLAEYYAGGRVPIEQVRRLSQKEGQTFGYDDSHNAGLTGQGRLIAYASANAGDNPALLPENMALHHYDFAANNGYVPAMLGEANVYLKKAKSADPAGANISNARTWLKKAQSAGSDEAATILTQIDNR